MRSHPKPAKASENSLKLSPLPLSESSTTNGRIGAFDRLACLPRFRTPLDCRILQFQCICSYLFFFFTSSLHLTHICRAMFQHSVILCYSHFIRKHDAYDITMDGPQDTLFVSRALSFLLLLWHA